MKDFMGCVKNELNKEKTFTENGAVAYRTAGSELLDFNFKLTSYRLATEQEIWDDFTNLFFSTDEATVIKYIFYVGDIREGLGERKVFKTCMKWLAFNKPETFRKVCKLIPEYSRWDILVQLIEFADVEQEVTYIIKNQFNADKKNMNDGKEISLLAKWLPSENASSKETRKLARKVMTNLHMSPKTYRRTLSKLRAYLDVVEVKMSDNRWNEIKYPNVPSKANLIYKDAFMKHDEFRRKNYLAMLKTGDTKINASVSLPHEVVNKYRGNYWRDVVYDETLEQIWKAIPNIVTEDTLVVRDGSGSMCAAVSPNSNIRALDVATALAIYCSENCTGGFKDKFITFSSNPQLVDLRYTKTLADKLNMVYNFADMSNTNIYRTMKLVLTTAILNNMEQGDMPKTILILSDMQFDCNQFNMNKTLFEQIKHEFEFAGYKLPRICFWNLCSYDAQTIPMQDNESGLILCSGFSINNLKMFMSGEVDPLKVLLDTINVERYEVIDKLLIN